MARRSAETAINGRSTTLARRSQRFLDGLANVTAVGTHDKDVGRAVAPACKRDQLAVWRPGRLDGEETVQYFYLVASPDGATRSPSRARPSG